MAQKIKPTYRRTRWSKLKAGDIMRGWVDDLTVIGAWREEDGTMVVHAQYPSNARFFAYETVTLKTTQDYTDIQVRAPQGDKKHGNP